jgi:glutathione S-transferase
MLTLYYSPGSCSLAPRIVLEDIGEPYELNLISIQSGAQNSPDFLTINPRGRIPVLIENGRVLVENLAILMYLATLAPQVRLLSSEPLARAHCVSVMAWLSNTVQPAFSRFFRPERISADPTAQISIKAMAKDVCWQNLSEIDQQLSRQDWLAGENYSVADPYGLVYYAWGKRIGLPVQNLESYTRFKDKMLFRKSVQTVLNDENSILLQAD